MRFKDKMLFISANTWADLKQNPFALNMMRTTFEAIVAGGGSVKLLMADGAGIQRSIDRSADIGELFAELQLKAKA